MKIVKKIYVNDEQVEDLMKQNPREQFSRVNQMKKKWIVNIWRFLLLLFIKKFVIFLFSFLFLMKYYYINQYINPNIEQSETGIG